MVVVGEHIQTQISRAAMRACMKWRVMIVAAGRKGKSEYWLTKDGLMLLAAWARDGATDTILAKNMGIGLSTLGEWKKKFPSIADALKRGKDPVDVEVENSLLKRALGYTVEVKKTFKVKKVHVKDGERREVEELQTGTDEVHIPADITAQIYWLKNRRADKWRDKPIQDTPSDNAINEGIIAIADLIRNPRPNRPLPKDDDK